MRLVLILLSSLIYLTPFAQESTFFQKKTTAQLELIVLTSGKITTLERHNTKTILALYNGGQLVDELELNIITKEEEVPVFLSLGAERFFLQLGDYAFNFWVSQNKIVQEKKVAIPDGPLGATEKILFIDDNISVEHYLNSREQYNVYIKLDGKLLKKNEKFNTSHLGGLASFQKTPKTTPRLIYSPFNKELFFHQPTDISYVRVELSEPDITIGLMYLEYNQSYTLRRYFDQLTGNRYVLKENKQKRTLLKVSSFNGSPFDNEYQTTPNKWDVNKTPYAIVGGKLLIKETKKVKDLNEYRFYLKELL
tara:strand:- start:945 stop:1868 length:924 start_codon:yes stop_codon:yes gene_type:complete